MLMHVGCNTSSTINSVPRTGSFIDFGIGNVSIHNFGCSDSAVSKIRFGDGFCGEVVIHHDAICKLRGLSQSVICNGGGSEEEIKSIGLHIDSRENILA